jgi:transposase
MASSSLPEEFWLDLEPLLPPDEAPGEQGGRPRVLNKTAMRGIFFVLLTGIRWEYLPREIGCCGMTCWRRLKAWQELEIWDQLHRLLLAALRKAGKLDLSLAVVDSTSSRAVGGGESTGPNPTDRRKPGTKQHLLVDRNGVPLEIRVTGANRHDVREIIPLIVNLPPIGGKPGPPLSKPKAVQADRAYHSRAVDALLKWLGITPEIAKRNTPHGSGLGKTRWVVERTIGWIRGFRRLRIRFDRTDAVYNAWNSIAASFICWRILME